MASTKILFPTKVAFTGFKSNLVRALFNPAEIIREGREWKEMERRAWGTVSKRDRERRERKMIERYGEKGGN
jgi:hypothetical protein